MVWRAYGTTSTPANLKLTQDRGAFTSQQQQQQQQQACNLNITNSKLQYAVDVAAAFAAAAAAIIFTHVKLFVPVVVSLTDRPTDESPVQLVGILLGPP